MKFNFIFLLFIIISKIISFPIFRVYKIILSNDVNALTNFYFRKNPKGLYLVFDETTSINLIPYDLFFQIKAKYSSTYSDCSPYDIKLSNGYTVIKCQFYGEIKFQAINLILENFGIKIIGKNMFPDKDNFIFLTKENQENIVIGKKLMKVMDIEFLEEGDPVIHNEEFVVKVKDD